jgi:hypothetical protein
LRVNEKETTNMKKKIDIMKRHIVFFGVLGAMAIAPLAHADYEIAYQIGGGAITTCLDNSNNDNTTGTTACSGSGSGILLTNLTGSSNSPGTPGLADEFSSSGSVTNSGSSPVTVTIWYLAQGFTMPGTGGGVTGIKYGSGLGGTGVNVTGTDTNGLESCVDAGAGGMGGSFCGSPFASLTNVTQTYPNGLDTSVNNSVQTQFSPLTGTYALEQKITLTLAGGDSVNYSDSQALTPVPEPMGVALLGGVLLLTSRSIQRRRKQQKNISA